jgi:hypothetical protein
MTNPATLEAPAPQESEARTDAEPFTPLRFLRFALTLIVVWALLCWVLLALL